MDSNFTRGPLGPHAHKHRRGPRNAMAGDERGGRRGPREGFGFDRPQFPNEAFEAERGRADRRDERREERRGGRGRHGFGGPGFGPGFGGHGRRGGRARRGDVRLAALLLLTEGPINGYQIITALEERSNGQWKPSPGAVYPALNQLEDEGLIQAVDADGRKLYELTEAGRTEAEQAKQRPAPWEQAVVAEGDAREGLAQAVAAAGMAVQAVMQTGDDALMTKAAEALVEARKTLYQLLAES